MLLKAAFSSKFHWSLLFSFLGSFISTFFIYLWFFFSVYVHPCLIVDGSRQFHFYDIHILFSQDFRFILQCIVFLVLWHKNIFLQIKSFIWRKVSLLILLAISLLSLPNQPKIKLFKEAINTLSGRVILPCCLICIVLEALLPWS